MTHPPQQPLDELQALIDKATPGPWRVYWHRPHIKGEPYRIDGDGDERILRWGAFMKPTSNRAAANARLIALAPQLAAENISLHQEIQRLREALTDAWETIMLSNFEASQENKDDR
jgi:hypothetical protein